MLQRTVVVLCHQREPQDNQVEVFDSEKDCIFCGCTIVLDKGHFSWVRTDQWHSIQREGNSSFFTDFRFRAWTVAPRGGK